MQSLTVDSRLVELVFNGSWPRGFRHVCRGVGKAFVGKRVALLGSFGQCVCAQHPRIGMSQRSMDRTVSSSFSFERKSRGSSGSWLNSAIESMCLDRSAHDC